MNKVNLNKYDNRWYRPGTSLKRVLWYVTNMLFFKTMLPFSSSFKVILLKLFGGKIGRGVVIKPNVNIKYPWFLEIGDHCWIGEGVWIDNLTNVQLGDHVVISQGVYLLTGSHDYTQMTFDLVLDSIHIENGVWLGAKATVCPGVTCYSHSVLSVGSTATQDLEAYGIYQGNPAIKKRVRTIK